MMYEFKQAFLSYIERESAGYQTSIFGGCLGQYFFDILISEDLMLRETCAKAFKSHMFFRHSARDDVDLLTRISTAIL